MCHAMTQDEVPLRTGVLHLALSPGAGSSDGKLTPAEAPHIQYLDTLAVVACKAAKLSCRPVQLDTDLVISYSGLRSDAVGNIALG